MDLNDNDELTLIERFLETKLETKTRQKENHTNDKFESNALLETKLERNKKKRKE